MRLALYLALTFAITWSAWWTLVALVPAAATPLATPAHALLYIAGGLAPALAAPLAVLATPARGALREYGARLVRWRISVPWYAVALVGPLLLSYALERLTLLQHPQLQAAPFAPLSRVLLLFPVMVIGGGLEELGWRGLAQPELQRRSPLLIACLCVGALWALWHLPLFFLHGVSQYGGNFPAFAGGVLAHALLFGWLYARTRSILLCVLCHAASNTAASSGLALPEGALASQWLAVALQLMLGALLILLWPPPRAGVASG
jgi:uncharacterized protein